jgi:transposase
MSNTTNKFSPEVRARAVRIILSHAGAYPSRWSAVVSVADKLCCAPQTPHKWVKRAEVDSGRRAGLQTDTAEKLKALKREVRELRQANEILRKASAYFCAGGARPPVSQMIAFIDDKPAPAWSSRSAMCCRLPLQPITSISHSGETRRDCRLTHSGI